MIAAAIVFGCAVTALLTIVGAITRSHPVLHIAQSTGAVAFVLACAWAITDRKARP